VLHNLNQRTSTTSATGAHSYSSRSLAGAVTDLGLQNTPPPCKQRGFETGFETTASSSTSKECTRSGMKCTFDYCTQRHATAKMPYPCLLMCVTRVGLTALQPTTKPCVPTHLCQHVVHIRHHAS
jgi:hypothetical protein